jgi:hypothetical protein
VVLERSIFWDITLCSRFKIKKVPEDHVVSGLFFDPEDGGDMFLPNVG